MIITSEISERVDAQCRHCGASGLCPSPLYSLCGAKRKKKVIEHSSAGTRHSSRLRSLSIHFVLEGVLSCSHTLSRLVICPEMGGPPPIDFFRFSVSMTIRRQRLNRRRFSIIQSLHASLCHRVTLFPRRVTQSMAQNKRTRRQCVFNSRAIQL